MQQIATNASGAITNAKLKIVRCTGGTLTVGGNLTVNGTTVIQQATLDDIMTLGGDVLDRKQNLR